MKERTTKGIFGGTPRKGQFFIISAVMILLVLYSVGQSLNSNWQVDVSEVQGNDAAEIFKNIEHGISVTINASDASNIEGHLDAFILSERSAIGDTYSLAPYFNITYPNVTANITLASKKFYAAKIMRFER